MKIGKSKEKGMVSSRPKKNASMSALAIAGVAALTIGMVVWVQSIGKKAEETVSVMMVNQPVHKNEQITEDMIKEYAMVTAEAEKYADPSGNSYSRLIPYSEENLSVVSGMISAYAMPQDTLLMTNMLIESVVDNSNTVLYSYPGKNLLPLEVGSSDLTALKSFLSPGDRINITAIYSEQTTVYKTDESGERVADTVDVFKEEDLFTDILLADILNSEGDSILDLYTYFNSLDVYSQVELSNTEEWKEQVTPEKILVALTPEEVTRYYQYLGKNNAEFHISLPQRTS